MRSFVDKKGVLFDLDGTLVDSKPGIFAAIRYTFRELQLPELSEEDMDRFIGPSIGSSFRNVCGFSDEETEQAIELFRAYYREKGLYECTVYPGLTRLLQILKEENRKVALSTKKPEIFARQILQSLFLKKAQLDCRILRRGARSMLKFRYGRTRTLSARIGNRPGR